MTYVVTLPNLSTINIQAGSIDTTSTSLTLVGKNVPNWGQYAMQDLVNLLANFESSTSPANPLNGQLWWDSGNGNLKVFNGAVFKNVCNVQSSTVAPNQNAQGDVWWNNSLKQLNVYDAGLWSQVGGYVLPSASSNSLGGVQVSNGLNVNTNGLLSLAPASVSTIGGIVAGSGLSINSSGVLSVNNPVASTVNLGIVKIGSGLSVDSNGLLSNAYSYTLPQASVSIMGGVKLGTGFLVNGPTTSVDFSSLQSQIDTLTAELNALLSSTTGLSNFLVPTGMISIWSGATNMVPTGWALCDGGTYTKVAGGTIVVPDLRNNFVIGAGSAFSVGQTGGSSSHSHTVTVTPTSLTIDQIPSHGHVVYDPGHGHVVYDPGHNHTLVDEFLSGGRPPYWIAGNSGYQAMGIWNESTTTNVTNISLSTSNTNITLSNTGSNNSHAHTATTDTQNTIPPYYALAYIIKL